MSVAGRAGGYSGLKRPRPRPRSLETGDRSGAPPSMAVSRQPLRSVPSVLVPLTLALAGCSSSSTSITPPPADAGHDAAQDAQDATSEAEAAGPLMGVWNTPLAPSPRSPFPKGFLFGSSTSAYQIEGGLSATDWAVFAPGHIEHNDDPDNGPRSRQFYLDDVAALADSHQNAYRFGIEWGRLFPTAASWAPCAAPGATLAACEAAASSADLAYYHALLSALKSHGITPLVTLVHSSLPTYIDDYTKDWMTTGWMRPGIVGDLGAWASFAAQEFGSEVGLWVTLNEPLTNLQAGFIDGDQPPAQMNDFEQLLTAFGAMVHAHAAMYDAIHKVSPTAKVSIAQDVHLYYPEDPKRSLDVASAKKYFYLADAVFLNAIVHGDLDANWNGKIDGGEPKNDPTLRGRVDYVGLNYYGFSIVQGIYGYPYVGGVTLSDSADHGLPKNDLGWDLYPRGFGEAIDFAGSYGVPVIVTENGLADATDQNRPRFLAEHLAELAAKIHAGANVLGYFHWAAIDNFEWTSGFCPRFGLYSVDYTDPKRARTARGSAKLYRSIIDAGQVTDAVLAAQPAYTTPTVMCASGI